MRARDLAVRFPTVRRHTLAIEAARLLAGQDLPGLIVVDDEGLPCKVLPGTQVLRMAVPGYCQDDPVLARVIDEPEADLFLRELGDRTVGDGLEEADRELPVVDGVATALEIASVMAASSSPVVAVVEGGAMLGAVTLDALL
ncbi:MAG TPA: CBS domain-containing protein, partial [Phytomonospora sp.]